LVSGDSTRGDQYNTGGTWEIDHGWDVFGTDGDKVGDVQEVQPHYIVVSKGFFFPTERYIPVSAITNVEHDRVYLNVTKNEIDSLGWDTVPDADYSDARQTRTTGADYVETGTDMDRSRGTTTRETDDMHVQLSEEQLDVRKREVERGAVRLRKDVVTEEQSVNVPLREEEVHIERHRVDARTGEVPDDAFQETTIEIPIRGEEVDVRKRAVVREEVDITKDVHEHNERVSDTVRREEVHLEGGDQTVSGRQGGTRGTESTDRTADTTDNPLFTDTSRQQGRNKRR
jgi:uncharacterized protein (TIGR02271 family)